jgi:hypothetical protein
MAPSKPTPEARAQTIALLTSLHATTSTLRSSLTSLASTTVSAEEPSSGIGGGTNPQKSLADALQVLEGQVTKLTLVLTNPPVALGAVNEVVADLVARVLPAVFSGSAHIVGRKDVWGGVYSGMVAAKVDGVLKAAEEYGIGVQKVVNGVGGEGEVQGGKVKRKGSGGSSASKATEKQKEEMYVLAGKVLELTRTTGKFATEGVAKCLVERVKEAVGLLQDAGEELKDWSEDVDESATSSRASSRHSRRARHDVQAGDDEDNSDDDADDEEEEGEEEDEDEDSSGSGAGNGSRPQRPGLHRDVTATQANTIATLRAANSSSEDQVTGINGTMANLRVSNSREEDDDDHDDAFSDVVRRLPGSRHDLRALLATALISLELVIKLYVAISKRRIKKLPSPSLAIKDDGSVEPTHVEHMGMLDRVIKLVEDTSEELDELAHAFYQLDREDTETRLESLTGYAKEVAEKMREGWTVEGEREVRMEDEFSGWIDRWGGLMDRKRSVSSIASSV